MTYQSFIAIIIILIAYGMTFCQQQKIHERLNKNRLAPLQNENIHQDYDIAKKCTEVTANEAN
jgi:hypothetical protein